MVWSSCDVLTFTLLIAALFLVVPASGSRGKRDAEIRLSHVCVNLNSTHEDRVPVIMLHGLTDIKETWDGIYQNVSYSTNRTVCAYDARNHGDSSWNDTFTVEALAEDLGIFMSDMKMEKAALVGHSMGGLTAMRFALKHPDKVESLFIEDISPVSIPKESAVAVYFRLQFLANCPSVIPNNTEDVDEAKKAVSDYILQVTKQRIPEYILKKNPLRRIHGVWQWKSNFGVFLKSCQDIDSFCGKMEGQFNGKTFFIYGKDSSFKVNSDEEGICKLFPKAQFFGVEGAGHSIHDQHTEFLTELIKFQNGN